MNTDLNTYYRARAKEYEQIYLKPERQNELLKISSILQHVFNQKVVLEIACGTGYWTEIIAKSATSVHATDINETVLEIAKSKFYPKRNTTFGQADIYNFPNRNRYDNLFAGFIWSHILLQDLDNFIQKLNLLVKPGGKVVLIDNNYVAGSNHPITHKDEEGNTYQTRKLKDDSEHLVLKNFPTEAFLRLKLEGLADTIEIIQLEYYWILNYRTIKI